MCDFRLSRLLISSSQLIKSNVDKKAIFFSIRVFFHGHWWLTEQQGKGGDHFLFHSTTSTRSRTFRHLFATLHVRWLSHIFNRNACIYQTATRWDFPTLSNYHLIDDGKFDLTCLLDDLILGFCYSNLDTRNQWTRTRINYHPCITSKLTNQANRLTKFCSVWSSQWKTTPFDLRWFCRKDILIS